MSDASNTATTPLISKDWYTSRTIWGGILAFVVPPLAMVLHVSVSDTDIQQIASIAAALGGATGGAIAIYGRIKATKAIGSAK